MKILHEQFNWKVTKSFITNDVITLNESFRSIIGFTEKPSGYNKKFPLIFDDDLYSCTITSRDSKERKNPWLEFICENLNSKFEVGNSVNIKFVDKDGTKTFIFERKETKQPSLMKNVKIYNINSSGASQNLKRLYSDPYIYWDIKSFENEEYGSEVFFIWREGEMIFYTTLLEDQFVTHYDEKQDTTLFDENGKTFNVDGKWGNFVKFEINDTAKIEKTWDFTDRLGNQNPNYYLFKNGSKLNKIDKRLQKIQDLKILDFEKDSTFERLLEIEKLLGNDTPNLTKPKPKMLQPKELVQHTFDYITNSGFRYQKEEIANFYLALRTKPFVILAGISGTGKTQLPRKFAEALGFSEEQVKQIPVKPDWTDCSELIGYVSLSGLFVPKELTLAIQEALKPENKNKPYFFILDEMNLARVEHYFSDFLSVIETRKRDKSVITTDHILRKEALNDASNSNDFGELRWAQNLFLIGTVNMDETTHTFSRKVLDRANSIEMNEMDLNWIQPSGKKLSQLKNVD